MQSFYRYSPKKYNDSLMALGNIRIGTLHDFRRAEHKQGIADGNEGRKTVNHVIDYADSDDGDSIHMSAIERFGAIQRNGARLIMQNVHVSREFNYPDCFVHCASFEYSKNTMSQFEGADSCVEIFDVKGFYDRLTRTLGGIVPVREPIIERVVYMDRVEQWDGRTWGISPALIKEPIFSPQVEVRAIWQPRLPGRISPIVINDVSLVRFCRTMPLPG